MNPLTIAIDTIFNHPHFGVSALFYLKAFPPPALGTPVRILLRQPDLTPSYGDTQLIVTSIMIEVRVSELPVAPVPGDIFTTADPAQTLIVLGGSRRDGARLTWVCEARES